VVHFEKLPEQIDPEEINEYLVALARDPKSPSRSSPKAFTALSHSPARSVREVTSHRKTACFSAG